MPKLAEETRKNEWWAAGQWIPCPDHNRQSPDSYWYYLWDGDYSTEEYKEMFRKAALDNDHPDKLYIYTFRDEDNVGYVTKGYGWANRLGYFFSKVEIPMREYEQIIFW